MTWFCIETGEMHRGTFHRLCRRFQRAFINAGAPAEMALFAQSNGVPGAHKLYFSPGSHTHTERLIETYDGMPCRPPDHEALTLLFGISDAEEQLFAPEAAQNVAPSSSAEYKSV